MKDLTRAQITVGLLAYFATIWGVVINKQYENLFSALPWILVQFVLMMILAYVLMFILQWLRIFDLRTNAILTLVVLVSIILSSNTTIF